MGAAAVIALVLLLATLGRLACAKMSLPGIRRAQPAITEEELRDELIAFSSRFDSVVGAAANEIRSGSRDPDHRRFALMWEFQVVPLVQEAAFAVDVQEAFVAVGSVTVMQRKFFTEGDGAGLLGDLQPIAVTAASELEEDFWRIGALFLSEAEVAKLRGDIDGHIAGRAITGRDFTVTAVRRRVRQVRQSGRFDWVVDLPMSPFRALEGVGSGAEAIHEFNETAREFARIVEGLPEQLRWQSQLLLYDVESRENLMAALESFQTLAESARELAGIDQRVAASLESMLGDTESALAQLNGALLTAQGMVEPLRLTAEQVNLAGESWSALFARDGEPDPDARPFDIREYEATARSIGEASLELRALAAELGTLGESGAMENAFAGVGSAVTSAEAGGRSVVDHAAWRALQLLLAFFGLLLAYRVVAPRLAPRSP
jgi:hypothetical protein